MPMDSSKPLIIKIIGSAMPTSLPHLLVQVVIITLQWRRNGGGGNPGAGAPPLISDEATLFLAF